MWKKDDVTEGRPTPPRPETAPPRNDPPRGRPAAGERATIGRSITIRGEVSGDEDLLIQGRVDGSVDLGQHSVTVGPEGQVKAGISGRVVTVEGEVQGDLEGQEQVILRSTAKVQGDIKAPRVVLEDGANFRGGVDMGSGSGDASRSASSRPSEVRSKAEQPSSGRPGNGKDESASSRDDGKDPAKDGPEKATDTAGKAATTGATA